MSGPSRAPEQPVGAPISSTAEFERSLSELDPLQEYVLRLFVAGSGERSMKAVERVKRVCEEHLAGRYSLEIVDIYQQPDMAERGDVVAAPTLVKSAPEPLRRVIGDMADEGRILIALGVRRHA
jgi:circadian clock protein KaiB